MRVEERVTGLAGEVARRTGLARKAMGLTASSVLLLLPLAALLSTAAVLGGLPAGDSAPTAAEAALAAADGGSPILDRRAPTVPQAPAPVTYTLAATLTLDLDSGPEPGGGTGNADGALCPGDRNPSAILAGGFLDRDRLVLATTCPNSGARLNLVVVAGGAGIDGVAPAPIDGDLAQALGFDPFTQRLLRSMIGSASRRVVNAMPLRGSGFPERTWNIVPAADDAMPQALAAGPGGVVYGFSPVGVARFGPGSERRAPWPARMPSGSPAVPGSLAVDSAGNAYIQSDAAGKSLARFSADGQLEAGWSLQELGDLGGSAGSIERVAGFAAEDALAVLEAVDGALRVRFFAPDGRVLAERPVQADLAPASRPELVVGPGSQYAVIGRLADGRAALAWHAADGSLRRNMVASAAPPFAAFRAQPRVAAAGGEVAALAPAPGSVLRWGRDGRVAASFPAPLDTVDIALFDDGDVLLRRIIAPETSRLMRLAPDGTPRWAVELGAAGAGLAVDGELVYAALPDEAGVALVSAADGALLGRLDLTGDGFWSDDLAAVPGGGLASVDGYGGQIAVWDPRAPLRPLRQLRFEPTLGPARVAVAADGRMAVMGAWQGEPGTVRVLDGEGRVVWDLRRVLAPDSNRWLQDLAYDGDGRLVVVLRSTRDVAAGQVLVFEPSGPSIPPPATATPAATPMPAGEGTCRVVGDKSAAPGEIWLGETVTVTLTLRRDCPDRPSPADIMLIIDNSGSMRGAKSSAAARAVAAFVEGIDLGQHRVGKVTFNSTVALVHGLSDDPAVVRGVPDSYGAAGGTDIAAGLALADAHLRASGRPGVRAAMVLISDGSSDIEAALQVARRARARGVVIFTVAIGEGAYHDLLVRVASSPSHFYHTLRPDDLPLIYKDIAVLVGRGAGAGVVDDTLAPDVELVPGSFNVAPLIALGAGLRWGLPPGFGEPMTLTYRVRPLRTGLVPTNVVAWLDHVDVDGEVRRFVYPVPQVLVRAPTSTPSTTPTMTPTSTPSPTPSPTPTTVPRPIYLPLALNERPCVPAQRHADVVLVIDTSTSMLDRTAGGRPKLDVALEAVRAFIGQLSLAEAGGDRAAIVAFNSGPTRLAGLTADRGVLDAALARVVVAPQTCIACGLEAAVAALAEARPVGVTRVAVLLTDGRSNPRPVADAEAVAAAAKAGGVVLFTIGLGADVEAEALARMASRPEFAYLAPTAEDLATIYGAVAGAIPCDATRWWGGR